MVNRGDGSSNTTRSFSSFSRNPIYAGFHLAIIGVIIAGASFWLLLAAVPFFFAMHKVILAEERFCIETYGESYLAYMKTVSRYLSFPLKNVLAKVFGNAKKPEGFLGRLMVAGMNGGSHASMANWGLDKTEIPQDGEILDIGCGGGANIARLLQRSKSAKVQGVDYSSVSVEKSREVNASAIKEGRCAVQEASVVSLPFENGTFNMVSAFETIYFWPDIETSFGEVKRVMKEGGTFLIVNEDDGLTGSNKKRRTLSIECMRTKELGILLLWFPTNKRELQFPCPA